MSHTCPLCTANSNEFYQDKRKKYFLCTQCRGIFLDFELFPDSDSEKERYLTHNNDVEDTGYQNFVSPIVNSILKDFSSNDAGLDFGAGTGPVISKMLTDNNFKIVQYDPFFHPYPELLTRKYDYIACCEVIEHFHDPYREFLLLKELLNPGGRLYCMTDIFHHKIDFGKWYYANDPTHVFIFQKETVYWIKEAFAFNNVTIEGRLITFEK